MSLPSEAQQRAAALQAAMELVTNSYVEALDLTACDVIDLAEYIHSGQRGIALAGTTPPAPEWQTAEEFLNGPRPEPLLNIPRPPLAAGRNFGSSD
jgi:hypothetical protein